VDIPVLKVNKKKNGKSSWQSQEGSERTKAMPGRTVQPLCKASHPNSTLPERHTR
jgi:hypothetical protein